MNVIKKQYLFLLLMFNSKVITSSVLRSEDWLYSLKDTKILLQTYKGYNNYINKPITFNEYMMETIQQNVSKYSIKRNYEFLPLCFLMILFAGLYIYLIKIYWDIFQNSVIIKDQDNQGIINWIKNLLATGMSMLIFCSLGAQLMQIIPYFLFWSYNSTLLTLIFFCTNAFIVFVYHYKNMAIYEYHKNSLTEYPFLIISVVVTLIYMYIIFLARRIYYDFFVMNIYVFQDTNSHQIKPLFHYLNFFDHHNFFWLIGLIIVYCVLKYFFYPQGTKCSLLSVSGSYELCKGAYLFKESATITVDADVKLNAWYKYKNVYDMNFMTNPVTLLLHDNNKETNLNAAMVNNYFDIKAGEVLYIPEAISPQLKITNLNDNGNAAEIIYYGQKPKYISPPVDHQGDKKKSSKDEDDKNLWEIIKKFYTYVNNLCNTFYVLIYNSLRAIDKANEKADNSTIHAKIQTFNDDKNNENNDMWNDENEHYFTNAHGSHLQKYLTYKKALDNDAMENNPENNIIKVDRRKKVNLLDTYYLEHIGNVINSNDNFLKNYYAYVGACCDVDGYRECRTLYNNIYNAITANEMALIYPMCVMTLEQENVYASQQQLDVKFNEEEEGVQNKYYVDPKVLIYKIVDGVYESYVEDQNEAVLKINIENMINQYMPNNEQITLILRHIQTNINRITALDDTLLKTNTLRELNLLKNKLNNTEKLNKNKNILIEGVIKIIKQCYEKDVSDVTHSQNMKVYLEKYHSLIVTHRQSKFNVKDISVGLCSSGIIYFLLPREIINFFIQLSMYYTHTYLIRSDSLIVLFFIMGILILIDMYHISFMKNLTKENILYNFYLTMIVFAKYFFIFITVYSIILNHLIVIIAAIFGMSIWVFFTEKVFSTKFTIIQTIATQTIVIYLLWDFTLNLIKNICENSIKNNCIYDLYVSSLCLLVFIIILNFILEAFETDLMSIYNDVAAFFQWNVLSVNDQQLINNETYYTKGFWTKTWNIFKTNISTTLKYRNTDDTNLGGEYELNLQKHAQLNKLKKILKSIINMAIISAITLSIILLICIMSQNYYLLYGIWYISSSPWTIIVSCGKFLFNMNIVDIMDDLKQFAKINNNTVTNFTTIWNSLKKLISILTTNFQEKIDTITYPISEDDGRPAVTLKFNIQYTIVGALCVVLIIVVVIIYKKMHPEQVIINLPSNVKKYTPKNNINSPENIFIAISMGIMGCLYVMYIFRSKITAFIVKFKNQVNYSLQN